MDGGYGSQHVAATNAHIIDTKQQATRGGGGEKSRGQNLTLLAYDTIIVDASSTKLPLKTHQ